LAPPRKPPEPGQTHPIHLRFPPDVFERITAKAKAAGIPINRVVINEVAHYPWLEMQQGFGESLGDMKVTLAQYGARLTVASLSESILRAIDEIIAAPTAVERNAPLDKLKVLRAAMVKHEREVAKMELEQLTAHVALMERQLAALEALPDNDIRKDAVPHRRADVERLRAAVALNTSGKREDALAERRATLAGDEQQPKALAPAPRRRARAKAP
jgi:hypothetical protein